MHHLAEELVLWREAEASAGGLGSLSLGFKKNKKQKKVYVGDLWVRNLGYKNVLSFFRNETVMVICSAELHAIISTSTTKFITYYCFSIQKSRPCNVQRSSAHFQVVHNQIELLRISVSFRELSCAAGRYLHP